MNLSVSKFQNLFIKVKHRANAKQCYGEWRRWREAAYGRARLVVGYCSRIYKRVRRILNLEPFNLEQDQVYQTASATNSSTSTVSVADLRRTDRLVTGTKEVVRKPVAAVAAVPTRVSASKPALTPEFIDTEDEEDDLEFARAHGFINDDNGFDVDYANIEDFE